MYKPDTIRNRTRHSTFGVGFAREVRAGLNSENVQKRLKTLHGLLSSWVEQRMDRMNYSDEQKAALLEDIKKGREEGQSALKGFRRAPALMKSYAPGYLDGADECALCNGASRFGHKVFFGEETEKPK